MEEFNDNVFALSEDKKYELRGLLMLLATFVKSTASSPWEKSLACGIYDLVRKEVDELDKLQYGSIKYLDSSELQNTANFI